MTRMVMLPGQHWTRNVSEGFGCTPRKVMRVRYLVFAAGRWIAAGTEGVIGDEGR